MLLRQTSPRGEGESAKLEVEGGLARLSTQHEGENAIYL